MSYADALRGALAATSQVARRVQHLQELGLPEDCEQQVQRCMDEATSSVLAAQKVLVEHGLGAIGTNLITSSAQAALDKSKRQERLMEVAERPWKSVRERVAETSPRPTGKRRARSYEELFPEEPKTVPEDSASEIDVSHPWRTT
jgi:hypothetical protein